MKLVELLFFSDLFEVEKRGFVGLAGDVDDDNEVAFPVAVDLVLFFFSGFLAVEK